MDQMSQQSDKKDISKQTLIVLVILTIMVSLLGTVTVIKETSLNKGVLDISERNDATPNSQGKVSLNVIGPDGDVLAEGNDATGYVSFEIVER